jgi:hypothetical protein
MFLRNFGNYLENYTASQLGTRQWVIWFMLHTLQWFSYQDKHTSQARASKERNEPSEPESVFLDQLIKITCFKGSCTLQFVTVVGMIQLASRLTFFRPCLHLCHAPVLLMQFSRPKFLILFPTKFILVQDGEFSVSEGWKTKIRRFNWCVCCEVKAVRGSAVESETEGSNFQTLLA